MDVLLEICAGTLAAVEAARRGGAARVELCSGLAEGGMTPSAGLIAEAVKCGIDVNVLIRPRPGDFLYSAADARAMLTDVRTAMLLGASGVATGALTADGSLDTGLLAELCGLAREINPSASLTLHRAFDLARDPFAALEQAIVTGYDRLLTSGCAPSAMEGRTLLGKLHRLAAGRIRIMAGGGVGPHNAAALASVADELHASARRPVDSDMMWRRKGVAMGAHGSDEYSRPETSESLVKEIINSLCNP